MNDSLLGKDTTCHTKTKARPLAQVKNERLTCDIDPVHVNRVLLQQIIDNDHYLSARILNMPAIRRRGALGSHNKWTVSWIWVFCKAEKALIHIHLGPVICVQKKMVKKKNCENGVNKNMNMLKAEIEMENQREQMDRIRRVWISMEKALIHRHLSPVICITEWG